MIDKKPIKNQKPSLKYSTPEHKAAGDAIALKILEEGGQESGLDLEKENMIAFRSKGAIEIKDFHLSFGDILAVAGDYYAIADEPISLAPDANTARERFISAYNTLTKTNQQQVVNKISKINNSKDSEYIKQLKLLFLLGRNYFNITNNNTDHFVPWCTQAYEVGHKMAMEMAQKAHELYSTQYVESKKYLLLAYQMEAFACHFLSDNFSSGHLRELKLREKLSEQFGIFGGILVNNMHNEDSGQGVNVTNDVGDAWTTYGDDNYATDQNKPSREIQYKALQQSANEIFEVYKNGKLTQESTVLKYLPQVNDKVNLPHRQTAPMFILKDNKIFYRNPITELNPGKSNYQPLTFFKALMLVIKLRLFPKRHAPKYIPSTQEGQAYNPYQAFPRSDDNLEPGYENTEKLDHAATMPDSSKEKREKTLDEERQSLGYGTQTTSYTP